MRHCISRPWRRRLAWSKTPGRGETCYPFSRARTRARQYDDDYEHEHGFDPPGVADAMIKIGWFDNNAEARYGAA
jgi:hypothetical protein